MQSAVREGERDFDSATKFFNSFISMFIKASCDATIINTIYESTYRFPLSPVLSLIYFEEVLHGVRPWSSGHLDGQPL